MKTMPINGATRLYAIVGMPVTHSLSPVMQNAAFRSTGINGAYVPVPSEDIEKTVQGLRALGFGGASVTIPHKETVMACVDRLDPVAREIGAVNTLAFEQHPDTGEVVCVGYNTDWMGSNLALAKEIELKGSSALVLGAGGAAKAVAFGLLEAGASKVFLANRTLQKAVALAEELGSDFVSLADIDQVDADILINTTSVGMTPHIDNSLVPKEYLSRYAVVMDIVYAPLETRLLKEAKASGCRTVDGLAMLYYQGLAQFKIWTGVEPPVSVMRDALLQELERRQ